MCIRQSGQRWDNARKSFPHPCSLLAGKNGRTSQDVLQSWTALAALTICLCPSSTRREPLSSDTQFVKASEVSSPLWLVQPDREPISSKKIIVPATAQESQDLGSPATCHRTCPVEPIPNVHRRRAQAPPDVQRPKPSQTQVQGLVQQVWTLRRTPAFPASQPHQAKQRTPRPSVQPRRQLQRPDAGAAPFEDLQHLVPDRQGLRPRLLSIQWALELLCLRRPLRSAHRPSIWQQWQPHPWRHQWGQEQRRQRLRRQCHRRLQDIAPVALQCRIPLCPQRRQVLLWPRQLRPLCHQEPFQLRVKAGPSPSQSSPHTGESAKCSAFCVTLPSHRQISPGCRPAENETSRTCSSTSPSCRYPRLQHCAQVGMVLTMQELRGRGACVKEPPVNHIWGRSLSSAGRADSAGLAGDVTVSECHMSSCMPVSTRQVLHHSCMRCTSSTSLAIMFVAVDVSAGSLSCSHCESSSDSWTDSGALLWLTSCAQGTMGRKKKVWIPPPPLDCTNLVADDAMVPGADILVTGGAHTRIHGLKGYVLSSSEENSTTVNIRLYQGHAALQSKIWCVDRSNVVVCGPDPPVEDDGLHPSLRWRLRPPPLTVFSARFVLGWQSLVPKKPEKRSQQDASEASRSPVTRLWQGVRRISKEGALLPQPKAGARRDPPLSRLQKELLSRLPLMTSSPTRPTKSWEYDQDLEGQAEMEEVTVEVEDASPVEKEEQPSRKAWPLDTSWPPAPPAPGQTVPRTANLDRPFAEMLQSGQKRKPDVDTERGPSSTFAAPSARKARTRPAPAATGPRRPKSIWFDTTEPSEVAAALRSRKRASRRQMFQTVLLISAANRAAENRSDAEAASTSHRSRRVYKRECAVSLPLWNCTAPFLHAWPDDIFHWPRSTATMKATPGQTPWGCSWSSSSVCSGPGNLAQMTLDNRPEYWQASSVASSKGLTDSSTLVLGLAQPPRTATSIPVGSCRAHLNKAGDCRSQYSGLPSTLAAGKIVLHPLSSQQCQTCSRMLQGWVDCCQDPQHCAICRRSEAQLASQWQASNQLLQWYIGCLDRHRQRHGFAHAQVAAFAAHLSSHKLGAGTIQDGPDVPASSPTLPEAQDKLPKATDAAITCGICHHVVAVSGTGMSEALATGYGGTCSDLAAAFTATVHRFLRPALGPSLRTTWATPDVRAVGGTMPNEHTRSGQQISSQYPAHKLGTRCPERIKDPSCWIWTAWIDLVQPGPALNLFANPYLYRTLKTHLWAPTSFELLNHPFSQNQSHPGPKPGGRPHTIVHPRTQDQSTGARVTGDCHSPVGPKDPRVGSDGKPWHEQHTQLVFVGTAQEGSLRWWPIQGRQTMTIFPQDAQMLPGTQLSATKRAESGMTVTYAALASPRSYMFSTCERKLTFYLVYMSRVPIRLLGTVAPALNHLTRSMDVQRTRSSCCRPSLVGTSLSALPQTMCRAPSSAPGLTTHCPVSTRPTRHRYPLASQEEGPDRRGVAPRALLRPRHAAQDPDCVTSVPECFKHCVFFSLALFQRLEGPCHNPTRQDLEPRLLLLWSPQIPCRLSRHSAQPERGPTKERYGEPLRTRISTPRTEAVYALCNSCAEVIRVANHARSLRDKHSYMLCREARPGFSFYPGMLEAFPPICGRSYS